MTLEEHNPCKAGVHKGFFLEQTQAGGWAIVAGEWVGAHQSRERVRTRQKTGPRRGRPCDGIS